MGRFPIMNVLSFNEFHKGNHMNTVSSARNPRWADQAHTSIVLWVVFEETKELYGEVPFAASADDPEPHGVDLFNRAIAGEFGEILEPTEDMVMAHVMIMRGGYSAGATEKINALANELDTLQDAVALGLATESQREALPALKAELDAYRLYRVQLAQLDAQPGFPESFVWPVPPASPFVYVKPIEQPTPFTGVSADELPK